MPCSLLIVLFGMTLLYSTLAAMAPVKHVEEKEASKATFLSKLDSVFHSKVIMKSKTYKEIQDMDLLLVRPPFDLDFH